MNVKKKKFFASFYLFSKYEKKNSCHLGVKYILLKKKHVSENSTTNVNMTENETENNAKTEVIYNKTGPVVAVSIMMLKSR